MFYMQPEWDHVATESEAALEYVRNVGRDRPECAWILSQYDSWYRNPFYVGPAVRHPEDYDEMDEYWYRSWTLAAEAARKQAIAEGRTYNVFRYQGGFVAMPAD